MEMDLLVDGRHACLTLSSSAPANMAMLVATLTWDRPMPPWRSLHERNAVAAVLSDIAQQIGVVPLLADSDASLPTCAGYERRVKTNPHTKSLDALRALSGPSGRSTK